MGSDEFFSALDNVLRRRILKHMSERGPLSFSSLLRFTGVETSKLSFHLGKMKPLINQDEQKRYCLSAEGLDAVKILSFIEVKNRFLTKKDKNVIVMDNLKNIGMIFFGGGILLMLAFPLYKFVEEIFFQSSDIPQAIQFGLIFMIMGLIILLGSVIKDRIKESEEEDDFSKY